jgi:DNA-directed RNA polymerase subunit RPC12/RpoP
MTDHHDAVGPEGLSGWDTPGPRPNVPPRIRIKADGSITISDMRDGHCSQCGTDTDEGDNVDDLDYCVVRTCPACGFRFLVIMEEL